ncbi:hypothetical protein [Kribbella sindirgiensis]|uniref:hypothetical protein n=1 Tax=Kribbella sindirgiensis TaxID=1124744 RepID=UPI0013F4B7B4|nr:hypothetical protein [Kribbella sindirgiensis]
MASIGYNRHPHGSSTYRHGKVKLRWPVERDGVSRTVSTRRVAPSNTRRTTFPWHLVGA